MIKKYPGNHERRVVEKFLLFPKKLMGLKTGQSYFLWLERVRIIQFYYDNRWIDFRLEEY